MKSWNNLEPVWQEILRYNAALENLGPDHQAKRSIWKSSAENYRQITGQDLPIEDQTELFRLIQGLKKIDCSGTQIKDLPPQLAELSLRELYCGRTSLQNIQALAHHLSLVKLCLFQTQVTDLKPVEPLHNLERFCCSDSPIHSLKPLQRLYNLQVLSFSHTHVSDLSPLDDLKNLRLIRCDGAPLNPEMLDHFKQTHPHCQIWTSSAPSGWDDFSEDINEVLGIQN